MEKFYKTVKITAGIMIFVSMGFAGIEGSVLWPLIAALGIFGFAYLYGKFEVLEKKSRNGL